MAVRNIEKDWKMPPIVAKRLTLAVGLAAMTGAANAAVVYSNAPAPGDVLPISARATWGFPVDATGWYHNNVQFGRSRNQQSSPAVRQGLSSLFGPAMAAKADIEYLPGAVNVGGDYASTASLGSLASLWTMAYEWFRDSASAANANQHPSYRVLLDRDGNLSTTATAAG